MNLQYRFNALQGIRKLVQFVIRIDQLLTKLNNVIMTLPDIDIDFIELINSVKGRFYNMGARTQANYHEAIDQILEEKVSDGEFPADFDVEDMREKLRLEWRDIRM